AEFLSLICTDVPLRSTSELSHSRTMLISGDQCAEGANQRWAKWDSKLEDATVTECSEETKPSDNHTISLHIVQFHPPNCFNHSLGRRLCPLPWTVQPTIIRYHRRLGARA